MVSDYSMVVMHHCSFLNFACCIVATGEFPYFHKLDTNVFQLMKHQVNDLFSNGSETTSSLHYPCNFSETLRIFQNKNT